MAGLVDSINPCAIASLIFFLSYLALGDAGLGIACGSAACSRSASS
jgi:hypothetical protein